MACILIYPVILRWVYIKHLGIMLLLFAKLLRPQNSNLKHLKLDLSDAMGFTIILSCWKSNDSYIVNDFPNQKQLL